MPIINLLKFNCLFFISISLAKRFIEQSYLDVCVSYRYRSVSMNRLKFGRDILEHPQTCLMYQRIFGYRNYLIRSKKKTDLCKCQCNKRSNIFLEAYDLCIFRMKFIGGSLILKMSVNNSVKTHTFFSNLWNFLHLFASLFASLATTYQIIYQISQLRFSIYTSNDMHSLCWAIKLMHSVNVCCKVDDVNVQSTHIHTHRQNWDSDNIVMVNVCDVRLTTRFYWST